MLQAGTKIGEYTLVEKLGRGAFSDVWLAEKRTPLSNTFFALKFFRPENADLIKIHEVQREIAVWQSVSGLPNIISVIEADFVEDYVYIVSEYADGGSLREWLKKRGGKAESIAQAVEIAGQILNGLKHLHQTGFIHRDLKPPNVLIRKGTFCLADFGVTREIKTHSVTQTTAGTYNYMPPEAFSKEPSVSAATDIWAVGAILHELLTGKLPFAQRDIPSLMYSILHEQPEPLPAEIPADLRAVVSRALRKNRAERFASAAEMLAALPARQVAAETEDLPVAAKTENVSAAPAAAPAAEETIFDNSFLLEGERHNASAAAPENAPADAETNPPAAIENETPAPPFEKEIEKTHAAPSFAETKIVPSQNPRRGGNMKNRTSLMFGLMAGAIILLGAIFLAARILAPNADEYYNRGIECSERKDYKCAAENFDRAIAANPDFADAYKHRAAISYLDGDFQKAIADYDRALEINPGDDDLFYGRGAAFLNSGDDDRALADFTAASDLKPDDAKYYFHRGLAYYHRRQFEKAIAEYDRAVALDANYAEAYNNRGNAFDELGKDRQAIEDYTRAIEKNGDYALAYNNRGTSYARRGEYDRAVADLTRAVALDPNLSTAYFNRANIFYLKKNLDDALADYDRFITQNTNNSLAYGNRGGIYALKGNYEQAIADYNRAVELNPQDAQNYHNRALAYEKIGSPDKARSDRQKYNDLRQ